jgi:predicted flap endonuclease-1-like 5' DNA nuclease
MNVLVFQTLLLLLLAFLIGCILGCWLKRLFASESVEPARPAAKPAAPAPQPAVAATPKSAAAFDWMAQKAAGSVVLEGMVPSLSERNAIVDDAKARFAGLDVDDRMTIGGKAPGGADWLGASKFALGQLEGLATGDAALRGTSYSLRGVAATKASYDKIRKALPGGLPAGLALGDLSLDVPPAAKPKPKAAPRPKAPPKPKATAKSKPAPAAAADAEIIKVKSDRELAGTQPRGYRKARDGKADDLKRIRGIGKVNEGKLNEFGIWHFDQIAAWSKNEIEWVDDYIAFPGRILREDWVGQAKVLAKGGDTSFSKRVDAGEVESSAGGASKKPRSGK